MRLLLVVVLGLSGTAHAHEMRPSMLTLTPGQDGEVQAEFRVGYALGEPMPLHAVLPSHCRRNGLPEVHDVPPVRTERWSVDCGPEGLTGPVRIDGLSQTGTDVVLRTPHGTDVLTPRAPAIELQADPESPALGGTLLPYLWIGVEHILLGPDHLLFVLGLVLLVGARARQLASTVTSFTVAHCATLALATQGAVSLPSRAVEAVIAASIVVLAADLARPKAGSWARRAPWVFAFACGLLHGFGFAGVLGEVGLPPDALGEALLGFNLGVELGQLAFVTSVVGLSAIGTRLLGDRLQRLQPALVYSIGAVGALWVWDRTLPILFDWSL